TCSTIFDLACSTDGFDTLCGLLTSFDLRDAISGGSWTVFAPTDEAFTKLDDALDGGIASVSDDLLLKILQFHVVDDQVLYSDDLPCELGNNLVTTLSGKDSRTFCEDDVPYGQKGSGNDEVVKFVGVDIDACNGVVHAVEDVLLFNLAPYM
ncbi:FAS1 domain-containing protein, partial [Fragilariopsis cylindrus CCMP1102]